ncbi:hypothetical protein [Dechloromonas denitrificans]|uniref:hypothetical protein n=1 Tax=Dechloromonas denitrificans TaxID=281362 RepID=UPI0012F9A66D|nr:hypothetical protein [Dechloromonas denitrificans]
MAKEQKSIELRRIDANENKWTEGFKFGASAVKSLAAVFMTMMIMDGLRDIVLNSPEHIDALGRFVERIRLGEGLGYLIAGGLGIAYTRERNGKKRLISQKARLQKELESKDPHRSSSGLNDDGTLPGEEE